jgi:hypothetical protein
MEWGMLDQEETRILMNEFRFLQSKSETLDSEVIAYTVRDYTQGYVK